MAYCMPRLHIAVVSNPEHILPVPCYFMHTATLPALVAQRYTALLHLTGHPPPPSIHPLVFPPGGIPSSFSVGADYNLGGPHTLGDLAAGIEWAPTLITASPAVLAASQTKRQSALPLSATRLRGPAHGAGGQWEGGAAGAGGEGSGSGRLTGMLRGSGVWNLGR